MRISFIGAGAMAQAITKHAVNAGHDVMISNSRGTETLRQQSKTLGCKAGTVEEVVAFGEIVFIAIPLAAYRSIPVAPLVDKIVVDLLNYFPHRDGHIPELEDGEITTSELVARHLPLARIVKAFNAITVEDLEKDARPASSPDRRALPICGDNTEAKKVMIDLMDQLGFDVVDGGLLQDSWKFERFRPAYCVPLNRIKLEKVLSRTLRETKVPDGYWLTPGSIPD
ncbi:NADPH-dependent F420 reductase [Kiloniella antarctica]|uniref:NADPH-dependent F420 reductase n=1 Tax=Kiloniella antarctica TaxID=1550907 RepID=A0ABW5BJL1_9PROT